MVHLISLYIRAVYNRILQKRKKTTREWLKRISQKIKCNLRGRALSPYFLSRMIIMIYHIIHTPRCIRKEEEVNAYHYPIEAQIRIYCATQLPYYPFSRTFFVVVETLFLFRFLLLLYFVRLQINAFENRFRHLVLPSFRYH